MPTPSCEATVTKALRSGEDRAGYGAWLSIRDIMDATGLGYSAVKKNMMKRWEDGTVEARLRGTQSGTTQEYRVRPVGAHAPLYPRQEGWNAQPLADCLGGFTYYHPADCR